MARLRTPAHRHLVAMVLGVVVLDALAVGAYFFAGVRVAAPGVRTAFTVVWTVATLAIVGVSLRRIRQERLRRAGLDP